MSISSHNVKFFSLKHEFDKKKEMGL